jgi:toxin ParE1/3/4
VSRLLWSLDAEADLDAITDYIAEDDPKAAVTLRDEIENRLAMLGLRPKLGRRGRVKGTREMVLAGTPYIGVYRVAGEDVLILRVLHGARRWPPRAKRSPRRR